MQRTNSDLRLNPHLHSLVLDGVFVEEPSGPPRFEQLPELRNVDVAEMVTIIRIRVLRLLVRRGVVDNRDELILSPTDLAERAPALAALAMAAVSGLPPAGPERREREPLRLTRDAGATITGPLWASDMGFTLHAARIAKRDDVAGREALARYVLRPPLAEQRVTVLGDGRVRIDLKRPFSDGTIAVEMDPLSLLCRLAASVPGPGFHTGAANWQRLLERLGEPTGVPPRAPARGPPYFKTSVLRRRFASNQAQAEMFDDSG